MDSLLIWNVRGLCGPSFDRYLKSVCSNIHPAIVALVERRSSDDKAFRCLKRLGFENFFTLPGRSGGLCMGWKSHSLALTIWKSSNQLIHAECTIENKIPFSFSLAYAIPHSNSRSHLWNDLEALSRRMNLAWILAGDFNDILGAEEKEVPQSTLIGAMISDAEFMLALSGLLWPQIDMARA